MEFPKLEPGMLLLFSNNGTSKLHKTFSFCIKIANVIQHPLSFKDWKWTHVAIIKEVDYEKGVVLIAEAIDSGFNDTFNGKKNEWGIKGLTERIQKGEVLLGKSNLKLKNVNKCIDKYKGAGYGWIDVLSISVYTILGVVSLFSAVFGNKVRLIVNSFLLRCTGADDVTCSEAVSRVLYDASAKSIDMEKEFKKPYDHITPLDVKLSQYINWHNFTNSSQIWNKNN